MSEYTTQVRFICEYEAGLDESVGYNDVDSVIAKSVAKIFNFDFPIWDENYRAVLASKILKHYYTREICAETVGLWKLFLNRRMNEIMPYYNELYKTTQYQFNPIFDVDYTREYDKTGTQKDVGNGSNNSTSNGSTTDNVDNTNWNLFSDTPQGGLENIDNETYLTTATKNTTNAANSGTSNNTTNSTFTDNRDINTTDKYIERVTGKTAGRSYARMIAEYRKTLLNIDMMIIDELHDLFMLIW